MRLDYGSTYASKFERIKGDRLIINTVRRLTRRCTLHQS